MMTKEIVSEMISYVLNITISEIPIHIAYVAISGLLGYVTAMIMVSFPCAIWEGLTKKKVNDDAQEKAICVTAIVLFIFILIYFLYEAVSR